MAARASHVQVDEAHGRRWQVALEFLVAGTQPIDLAGVRVWRDNRGPRSDGSVHIDVCSPFDPRSLTRLAAEREVDRARRVIGQASADPRFAQLLASNRVVWELVWDYGQGSIRLASIDQQGRLAWEAGAAPAP
jgi:hypothetical protein